MGRITEMVKKSHKQVYKQLTKTQSKKAISLAKKGVSQQKIAKTLGIAKQSVASHLRWKGVGKRAPGAFWADVKHEQTLGYSWKEARERIYKSPKWGKKRAKRVKKEFKTWQDFWDEMKRKYKYGERTEEVIAEEMEDLYLVSV